MLREKPGNVVVLSGRNRGKIDRILAAVEAGLNVLADKPWLIAASDFPKLERALAVAAREAARRLRRDDRALGDHHDPAARAQPGPAGGRHDRTRDATSEPALELASVHHILKLVAGAPNLRPAWFFDTDEQGEGLADVATHLVDLVPFLLFPGQPIDHAVAGERARRPAAGRRCSRATSCGA